MTWSTEPRPDGPASVIAENLRVSYGVGRRRVRVLNGCSLQASPGEVTAVAGRNGEGKTTLFRTLLGLHPIDGGSCRVAGQEPGAYRRSQGIGLVPHGVVPPRGWSGRGLLGRGADLAFGDRHVAEMALGEALEFTGLTDEMLDKPLRHCSTGTLQRIYLGYAMIGSPRVMLFDEPFSGLDPVARIDLRAKIQTLASEGVTVLMASHDLSEVVRLAHKVFLLSSGRAEEVPGPDMKDVDRLEERMTQIGG